MSQHDLNFTPEMEAKIAKAIMENKPYLIEIEEAVQKLGFGSIDIRLEVRGGTVEKMTFYQGKNWLKEKAKPNLETIIETRSVDLVTTS